MTRQASWDGSSAGRATWALVTSLALLFIGGTAWAESPGTEDPNNWPQYHRTSNGWRFSPLEQINKSNVGKLKVAWIHQAGDITHGIQETPIVIDGVVYSITAQNRALQRWTPGQARRFGDSSRG